MHQPRIDFGMILPAPNLWIGTVLGDDQGSQMSGGQVQKSSTSQLTTEAEQVNQHWIQSKQRESEA